MKTYSKIKNFRPPNAKGFTIAELMIATLVFSVILIVITAGVTHFTTSYYKGINSSTTQTVTSSVISTASQAIQFSDTKTIDSGSSGGIYWYCINGGQELLYHLGVEVQGTNDPNDFGILSFNSGDCYNSTDPSDPHYYANSPGWDNRQELLQKNMRVTDFTISKLTASLANPTPPPDTWSVSATVAYGDADLLCDANVSPASDDHGCGKGAVSFAPGDTIITNSVACKLNIGAQFCSFSRLGTSVQVRIQ